MPTIVLPYPPKQLMPNFKRSHHWSAYRKQIKAARTLAWGLTAQALGRLPFETPDIMPIQIRATPPMRGGSVADADNLLGACKHYLDGLSDATGINDSRFRVGEVEFTAKAGDGKIEISF